MLELKCLRGGGVNQVVGCGKSEVDVARHLPQAAKQLGEDNELRLHVRILHRADGIEQPDQISLLIGKSDAAVAQVECLRRRDNSRLSHFSLANRDAPALYRRSDSSQVRELKQPQGCAARFQLAPVKSEEFWP